MKSTKALRLRRQILTDDEYKKAITTYMMTPPDTLLTSSQAAAFLWIAGQGVRYRFGDLIAMCRLPKPKRARRAA